MIVPGLAVNIPSCFSWSWPDSSPNLLPIEQAAGDINELNDSLTSASSRPHCICRCTMGSRVRGTTWLQAGPSLTMCRHIRAPHTSLASSTMSSSQGSGQTPHTSTSRPAALVSTLEPTTPRNPCIACAPGCRHMSWHLILLALTRAPSILVLRMVQLISLMVKGTDVEQWQCVSSPVRAATTAAVTAAACLCFQVRRSQAGDERGAQLHHTARPGLTALPAAPHCGGRPGPDPQQQPHPGAHHCLAAHSAPHNPGS